MKGKTVLVTGASGLLGSAIVQRFRSDGREVVGLCNRNPRPGLVAADLSDRDAVLDLARLDWDTVVNCAAFRSPDYCEQNPEPARVLNTRMPEWLASMAAVRQAAFVHISTDYVFPGTQPPYTEASPVAPVNLYGDTKVQAEEAIRHAHPGALIARVPALYGVPPPPAVSSLLKEGIEGAMAEGPLSLDDVTVRYPTHVDDVAAALSAALDASVTGILHISAGEAATRYAWTCRIAGWLGRDASRLTRGPQGTGRPARRPVDCHLSTGRLEKLGLPVPRPYGAVMPELLRSMGLGLK